MKRTSPIGIFDSGLGGLTVLHAIQKILPQEHYIYFGDTAHVPYGNKSKKTIVKHTQKIVEFLTNKNVKLIIVACNTASSLALNILRNSTNIPIIDVIMPVVKKIQHMPQINNIALIGTHNTISSKAYDIALHKINERIKIKSIICPMFVPLIEEGLQNHKIMRMIAEEYLDTIIKNKKELLILGCTHYPIITPLLQSIIPYNIQIIDSAKETANFVKASLIKHNLLNNNKLQNIEFIVSDQSLQFNKFVKLYFKGKNIKVHQVNL